MSEDYRPDLFGHVEASYRTGPPPQDIVDRAMNMECPDCNINVFIEEQEIDGVFKTIVAHDETCPWLKEKGETP